MELERTFGTTPTGRPAGGGLAVAMNADAPMAQIFVERDLRDEQALGNLIHTKFLFAIQRLSDDSRTLGFFG